MSLLSDTDLAFKIQESNDSEALEELISRHSGIYVDTIRKVGGKMLTETQVSDLMGEKDYYIYNTALEYDPEKSKFSTYLATKTRFLVLTGKTNNKIQSVVTNFDDESFHIEDQGDSPDEYTAKQEEETSRNELVRQILQIIDSHPDPRIKTIFENRYFSNQFGKKLKPWHEIAPIVDLSIQGTIDAHNRTLPYILKNIEHNTATF